MEIYKTISEAHTHVANHRLKGSTVGLVPTMGALHAGHMALLKTALAHSQFVVFSIFVNPIQFTNATDLEKYPRTLENDLHMLEEAGCHAVFIPSEGEMYPRGKPQITFEFGEIGEVLEAKFRPGHFSGVAVVVSKLFHITAPHSVFFGQKDFQQCLVVNRLIQELSFPIQFHMVDTLREHDGLAMSSRNVRLTPSERTKASILYSVLKNFFPVMIRKGLAAAQKQAMDALIDSGFEPEYIACVDFNTGAIVSEIIPYKKYVICAAAQLGSVRLIDNVIINS